MKQYFMMVTVALPAFLPLAAAAQDVEAGATVFKKCTACHSPDATTNKIGPHLGGLIGRKAGTVSGFSYSKAMTDAGVGGLAWNEDTLAKYLVEILGFDSHGEVVQNLDLIAKVPVTIDRRHHVLDIAKPLGNDGECPGRTGQCSHSSARKVVTDKSLNEFELRAHRRRRLDVRGYFQAQTE